MDDVIILAQQDVDQYVLRVFYSGSDQKIFANASYLDETEIVSVDFDFKEALDEARLQELVADFIMPMFIAFVGPQLDDLLTLRIASSGALDE